MKKKQILLISTILFVTVVMLFTQNSSYADGAVGQGENAVLAETLAGVVASGMCGENITWSLDEAGVLTIDGSGDMFDYYFYHESDNETFAPWHNQNEQIKKVIISTGVTSIGQFAFFECHAVSDIQIPATVERIGKGAFYECANILGPTLPSQLTLIDEQVFCLCGNLKSLYIPDGVESIGNNAFSYYDAEDGKNKVLPLLTIFGFADSVAEAYATANVIPFEVITEPAFATNSLVLSGEIGVNFYMDLPEIEGIDYEDSFMEFTLCGKTVREDFDATRMNPKGTYYKFTCYANAIQMADEITAVFHYVENGEEKTLEQKYSVQEYIRSYEGDDSWADKLIALVHALADYGHYAQIFLSEYKGWQLGTDHAVMDTYYTSSYADVEQFKEALGDQGIERETNADVTAVSFSLSLDSSTTINLYFSLTDGYGGGFSVTVDGNQVAAKRQADGRYRVTIPSISAHRLGRRFAVQTTTDAGVVDVAVSALSYVKACLDAPLNANETAAISALYRYYETAIAYIG